MIIVGQSILAFALLMQLVKISQRVDANGTMPVVKEILILAVFFFIGSYLVNHSFDICTAAYDEINKLISEVTSNNNRQTIGGIVLGDTTSVDEEHADLERVTAALAETKEAAVRDLADMPSELDMHPELTEEDDKPWNFDAEMDRLMELDADVFWENAHELPFDIGDSGDDNR